MTSTFDPKAYTQELRENWNAAAPHYKRLSADFFPPIAKAFVDFCALKPGQSVLDVACGPGTATVLAKSAVGPKGKVVGVDLSVEMLKLAGERLGAVDLREMDAEEMDFPDASFDAVICQLGLMLFARPEAALSEMIRVVKPGGKVSCLVQGAKDKMVFTSLIMSTMIRHAPDLKAPGAPNLYAFGGEGRLEWALKTCELKGVRTERLSGTFGFASPEAYWETMASGAGRTGMMLKSLPAAVRSAIKQDVLKTAENYLIKDRMEIPYEVVMASGSKA
ncbi:MAG: methyltransferase domain-containing protein [Elusimicrobia bacterium]|nr:methyltransferase domain-containing protein [Elusimicrobiota bacterium]